MRNIIYVSKILSDRYGFSDKDVQYEIDIVELE